MKRTKTFARAFLLALFVGATVLGGVVLWTLSEQVKKVNVTEQSDPLWIASQLQFEMYRLKDELNRYIMAKASPEDVSLRFDIAWSRIDVVQSGRMRELIKALNIDDRVIGALEETFIAIEPKIMHLPPLKETFSTRLEVAGPLLGALDGYDQGLRDLSLDLSQTKAKMMFEFRNGVVSLSHAVAYLFFVILVLAASFSIFLFLELRASRATAAHLKKLAVEAESASRAKDKFMSSISHELRTPLTSIVGGIRLLRASFNDKLGDGGIKILGIAERNCERLLTLVGDILDAQDIVSGEVNLQKEPINLIATIQEALEDSAKVAQSQHVTLKTEFKDEAFLVVADRDRIAQVMRNLLSNAVKFTTAGDTVIVRTIRTDGWIRVEVEDHGIGIERSEHRNIFTHFHQINPGERGSVKSSGLGLSMSKQIIEMHGGKIGFESSKDAGSTFWFMLEA